MFWKNFLACKKVETCLGCSQDMENRGKNVLKLKKTIYKLLQAAKAFDKKLVQVLKNLSFVEELIDPCLLMKKEKKSIIYIALYVDKCLCCGNMKKYNQ